MAAKIFRSAHQSIPKKQLPISIDGDPCGKGVIWRREPACKSEAIAWLVFWKRRQGLGSVKVNGFTPCMIKAPVKDVGLTRFFELPHHHDFADGLYEASLGIPCVLEILKRLNVGGMRG